MHDKNNVRAAMTAGADRIHSDRCQTCGATPEGDARFMQFMQMHRTFGEAGGILSHADLASRLRRVSHSPLATLAAWTVDRAVVKFTWLQELCFPAFQFDLQRISPHPLLADVMHELNAGLEDWQVASWFAEPNERLSNEAPARVFRAAPDWVLDAARWDRRSRLPSQDVLRAWIQAPA